MKKFIVFIITAIILAISTSFTAKAQYATPPSESTMKVMSSTKSLPQTSLAQTKDYINAKEMERKGQSQVFQGAVWQILGGAIAYASVPLMEVDEGLGTGCLVIGGVSAVVGTAVQVIGAYKWVMGSTKKRDLRFEYALRGNGLVVSF